MRRLPDVGPGFDAASAVTRAYAMNDDLRRELRTGIGKAIHGWFPSSKVGALEYVGQGQADMALVLDLMPSVATYVIWPLEVRFAEDGRSHSWTPDFGILSADGRQAALDILTHEDALLFREHRLEALMRRTLAASGVSYAVREQSVFRRSKLHRNAAFAQRFRTATADQGLADRIEDLLVVSRKSLRVLQERLPDSKTVIATACSMACDGRLALDLDADEPVEMTVGLTSKAAGQ